MTEERQATEERGGAEARPADAAAAELGPGEIRLFVYGTFLAGEANHAYLRRARFLGSDRTRAAYELFDLGGFPALVSGGESAIEGEVYAVGHRDLLALDEFEDAPDFYRRAEVELAGGDHAEAYVLPRGSACAFPRIDSGDWRRRAGR